MLSLNKLLINIYNVSVTVINSLKIVLNKIKLLYL